jgi:predicted aminopeptidase
MTLPLCFTGALLSLLFLTGCGNLLYLSSLGWHQARITFKSVPVRKVLEGDRLEEAGKAKIRFILDVKRFGEDRLGLRRTGNYTTFFEIQGPVLHVLTACAKDRLEPLRWRFPIAGTVAYKGYFSRPAALREKAALDRAGYDTLVLGAGAYSTLGWLRDPIFSPMLRWKESALASLILHEMTHGTLYFPGDTEASEQVATFVGNRGAIEFLTFKHGADSKPVQEAIEAQEDDLLFGSWIDGACRRLERLYAEPVSREEKLVRRGKVFSALREEYLQLRERFRSGAHEGFGEREINNAVLLAYRCYYHRLDRYERYYEQAGRDLPGMIERLKKAKAGGKTPADLFEADKP